MRKLFLLTLFLISSVLSSAQGLKISGTVQIETPSGIIADLSSGSIGDIEFLFEEAYDFLAMDVRELTISKFYLASYEMDIPDPAIVKLSEDFGLTPKNCTYYSAEKGGRLTHFVIDKNTNEKLIFIFRGISLLNYSFPDELKQVLPYYNEALYTKKFNKIIKNYQIFREFDVTVSLIASQKNQLFSVIIIKTSDNINL